MCFLINLKNLKNYFVKNFIIHLYFLLNINILCHFKIIIVHENLYSYTLFPNLFYYITILLY